VRPLTAAILIALLYVLHQDVWFWRAARPLVFGFLPVGLFYHAAFTSACAVLMWVLVKRLWPAHLESDGPELLVRRNSLGETSEGGKLGPTYDAGDHR
jgi:hypothetical protein